MLALEPLVRGGRACAREEATKQNSCVIPVGSLQFCKGSYKESVMMF